MIWTIAPAIVLVVLIGYGLWQWNNVMYVANDEDPMEIEIYAKQFNWHARYAGADNTLGLEMLILSTLITTIRWG